MQRKDIKIGEKYGVLAFVSKKAQAKSGATVVDFDGKFMGHPYTGSYRMVEKTGGITIRFDEPVVKRWDGYTPLQEILDGQWVDGFKEDAKKEAITVDVLPSARHIVGPWSEIVSERDAYRKRQDEWREENRAKAEALRPRRQALVEALDKAGILDNVQINYTHSDIGDGEKEATGFKLIAISPSALEKLLGIGGEA